MPTAAALLNRARENAQLTQDQLGRRAGTSQPNIARTERGHSDVLAGTLDRWLHAAGHRLILIPSSRSTAADAAESALSSLGESNDERAYRSVIQLADDLAAEHGAERVALAVSPPRSTGDARYDAFIAGVVEYRLSEESLPLPTWLTTAPRLDAPWHVDPSNDPDAIGATPAALRSRGVIIGDYELASV